VNILSKKEEFTSPRKLDHILITYSKPVESSSTMLDEVILIHQSLPELSLDDVNTKVWFLGKKLDSPLMITGMTGGHPLGAEINAILAEVAEEHRIALGVGSQRAALEKESLAYSYRVAREKAPSIPLIANIGAPQLVSKDFLNLAEKAVEMIEADALAIHLNPAQESFQPGGDTVYRGVLDSIGKIVDELGVPVIVKETGSGFSMETVRALYERGVRIIDVSGAGGTSWIKVEKYRASSMEEKVLSEAAETFSLWGIPTAISVIEARHVSGDLTIIASGGIRTGLDIAKSIAIGADVAGIALPALKKALESRIALSNYIRRLKYELKVAMFLTGSLDTTQLRTKPVVLGTNLVNWLRQRGIDPLYYIKEGRMAHK
jgi:isopentenyl-diphosphate delta-isomerase